MIIFDLDGTLADCAHRRHLVHNLPRGVSPRWQEFFARCVDDRPIVPMIDVLHAMRGMSRVEIWSGRDESVRPQTEAWLEKYVWYEDSVPLKLVMRPAGNTEPDEVLKERWLDELPERMVELVFDDRNKVVAMWRRRGIICAQVAEGNF